jgi:uncharacterized coiled-coil protein SlyX
MKSKEDRDLEVEQRMTRLETKTDNIDKKTDDIKGMLEDFIKTADIRYAKQEDINKEIAELRNKIDSKSIINIISTVIATAIITSLVYFFFANK